MRKSETVSISELVNALLKKYGAEDKIAEVRLIRAWEQIMGRGISKFTRNIYIKDRILFVSISSSVVKAEILMIKNDLIKKLNEQAGKELIDQIVIR